MRMKKSSSAWCHDASVYSIREAVEHDILNADNTYDDSRAGQRVAAAVAMLGRLIDRLAASGKLGEDDLNDILMSFFAVNDDGE